jgi:anti-anti-sigma regulatory factor
MTLRLTEQITKDVATVTVAGDLDVYASDSLRQVLRRFSCACHHRVVVDLTACTFLSMTCPVPFPEHRHARCWVRSVNG